MLKYEIYDITDDDAKLNSVVEIETSDSISIRRLCQIDKDEKFYIRPVDAQSIYFLKRSQRRGNSKLSDDHIVKIFRLKANENLSAFKISVRLKDEDDIVASTTTIENVLMRRTYRNVVIPDELIKKIDSNQMGSVRKRRKSISPEDKHKILKLYDNGNGLSCKKISQMDDFDYSDTTITTFVRKELGYMRDGKRIRK